MIRCLNLIRFILLLSLMTGMVQVMRAGDSVGVAAASVIRTQLQSIAGEVVGKAKLDKKEKIVLRIEGEEQRLPAENAFVETLQKHGYKTVLNTGSAPEQVLHILLLGSEIKINSADEKYFERSIITGLEARTIIGEDREIRVLGTFSREKKDRAQVFPSFETAPARIDADESWTEKLLTPLIVLSGAALIIFLLFTVRS
ncbi:MAG: hypothetical protein JXA06_02645 [Bacteroidetes bacterium]|nr:hypothetical protein [Bacteroidota bacterium]